MKTIRIVSGVFGYQSEGRITPVKAGDPPVVVKAEVAERLVKQGFALYVGDNAVATNAEGGQGLGGGKDPLNENEPPKGTNDYMEQIEPPQKPEYNADMKMDELKLILEECEIPFRFGMSKADIVDILDEYFGEEDDGGERFPVLDGQGVVP